MTDDGHVQQSEKKHHFSEQRMPQKNGSDEANDSDLDDYKQKQSQLENNNSNTNSESIRIIIYKKNRVHNKKRKKYKIVKCTKQHALALLNDYNISLENRVKKLNSMPDLNPRKRTRTQNVRNAKSCYTFKSKSKHPFNTDIFSNYTYRSNPLRNPFRTTTKIYRCENDVPEEKYCSTCNSDAMFEVMKSLYECYKKKTCDKCPCILCGRLTQLKKKEAEKRKIPVPVTDAGVMAKDKKEEEKKAPTEKEKELKAIAEEKEKVTKAKAEEKEKVEKEKEKVTKAKAEEKEKELKAKAKAEVRPPPIDLGKIPFEKLRKAKAAGLLTPLVGKSQKDKEKIVQELANLGIPLPEGKTASEKKLFAKYRNQAGFPPLPKTAADKEKYQKAVAEGVVTPLEGKTNEQKEKALRRMLQAGIALPEGRTASEKALIAKVKAPTPPKFVLPPGLDKIPSEKIRKAKAAGLFTPLDGKSQKDKEKIVTGLAKLGIPLPEGKTASEKKLIAKVRNQLGLPPEPKTAADREKYNKAVADGVITPLEGKTKDQKEKVLRDMVKAGIPLPEGRTPSEKALIAKIKTELPIKLPSGIRIPSEKLRQAKAAGLLTPLEGKTKEQKEKILKGLVLKGIPLPIGRTPSEKKLIDKVRADLGLPPEPQTEEAKAQYKKALAKGLITPLEGKTPAQKENVLQKLAKAGIALPEGRTASEKALIAKIKAPPPIPTEKAKGPIPKEKFVLPPELGKIPSEKLRKAKEAGLLTPLHGKSQKDKEKIVTGLAKLGIPLPEGKTASEKKLIAKVRNQLGLPPEPKTAADREKYNKAVADGIITPLEGKPKDQKEKILKKLKQAGVVLPEGRTPSEKALIAKVTGQAPPPRLPEKELQAQKAEREKAILAEMGKVPSEKLKKAKAAGLITPLEGKSQKDKEKIISGLAKLGIPLPKGKTPSEIKLIAKVRGQLGLPPEPKTAAEREKYQKAVAEGIVTPLEGKTKDQKEQILRKIAQAGIALPEGRTSSEKALIAKIKAELPFKLPSGLRVPPEKLRKAKAAGFITPLEGKTPAQKEKILKGLATHGIPLPVAKTPSDMKLIEKVRADLGLPPEPKTEEAKEKYKKALASGLITPLEGKTRAQKEKVLKKMIVAGIDLPEGRTASEKALIAKLKGPVKAVGEIPSEKLRKAKAAGLLTPLDGKTPEQKEKILRELVKQGLPLPPGKTASEKKLIEKIRAGIPPPTEGRVERKARPPLPPEQAKKLDLETTKGITEGTGPVDECICDLLTPESERGITATVPKKPATDEFAGVIPSAKAAKARAEGLLTPLTGKTKKQKEKILSGLAKAGIPLPEGQTESEKKLIEKVRHDVGLPPTPKTKSEKLKLDKATAAGIVSPLNGKTAAEKEKILKATQEAGISLPEGRTKSEKAIIAKVKSLPEKVPSKKAEGRVERKVRPPLSPEQAKKLDLETTKGITEGSGPVDECICDLLTPESERGISPTVPKKAATDKFAGVIPLAKAAKARAEGLLTPLTGKTKKQKEKILNGLAKAGLPLPEGQTASEKKLIEKVRQELGLPPSPKTKSEKLKLDKATAAGIVSPLKGKTAAEKEKILKATHEAGIPLPEGQTKSEKALIAKVKGVPEKVPSKKAIVSPLDGKTKEQKEQILRKMVKAGVDLPEGRTASEKSLISKVKAEGAKAKPEIKPPAKKTEKKTEKPPPPPKPPEKKKEKKAEKKTEKPPPPPKPPEKKAEKPPPPPKPPEKKKEKPPPPPKPPEKKKEKPPPPPKPPEKKIVKPPPSPKPPEKKIVKTKAVSSKPAEEKAVALQKGEVEDLTRTSKCDRACGCDKKKIRFKHSYVKIRVTSLDMSSLCACPPECIPEFKRGVFLDDEGGIKVTVGTAITGTPSFTQPSNIPVQSHSSELQSHQTCDSMYSAGNDFTNIGINSSKNIYTIYRRGSSSQYGKSDHVIHSSKTRDSELSLKAACNGSSDKLFMLYSKIYASLCPVENTIEAEDLTENYSVSTSKETIRQDSVFSHSRIDLNPADVCCETSYESVALIKTESSLSLLADSNTSEISSLSVYSFADSNFSYTSGSHVNWGDTSSSEDVENKENHDGIRFNFVDATYFCTNEVISKSSHNCSKNEDIIICFSLAKKKKNQNQSGVEMVRVSDSLHQEMEPLNRDKDHFVVINDASNALVEKAINDILTHSHLPDLSSVFLLIPSDDCDTDKSRGTVDSTILLHLSHTNFSSARDGDLSDKRARSPSSSYEHSALSSSRHTPISDYLALNEIQKFPSSGIKFDVGGVKSACNEEKQITKKKLGRLKRSGRVKKWYRLLERASRDNVKKLEVHYTKMKMGTVATDTSTDKPYISSRQRRRQRKNAATAVDSIIARACSSTQTQLRRKSLMEVATDTIQRPCCCVIP